MPLTITQHPILVVDDDREIVRLVRAYLEKAGFPVLVAYDGETALHILRRDRPALMILDLMLPDRDGWDITRLVRGDPTLAQTLIIMLTARVEDTDKIVGLELGADDYVTKPFNPAEPCCAARVALQPNPGCCSLPNCAWTWTGTKPASKGCRSI
jgi:two-component system alkaline phosphatase synthesis response regulator PhoP